jgi:hypothetical protein
LMSSLGCLWRAVLFLLWILYPFVYCQRCIYVYIYIYIYINIQNIYCNSGFQTVSMYLWWWSLRTETCKGMKNWNKKNFTSHTGRNCFIFYNIVSVMDQNETDHMHNTIGVVYLSPLKC